MPERSGTEAMTDKPDVIAQAGSYRVLAGGTLEYLYHADQRSKEATWAEPVRMSQEHQDLAALLADAVRQVREYVDNNIGALDESVSQDHVAMHELEIRLAVAEKVAKEAHRRIDANSPVRAELAVSRVAGHVKTLVNRLAAVEMELEMPRMWARMQERAEQLYRERMEALEARHQDEAGEGAITLDDIEQAVRYAEGYGTVDPRLSRGGIRRETAREIAERMDQECRESEVCVRHIAYWIDWIKRKFGGGSG